MATKPLDLIVVMPVYNEQDAIVLVVSNWYKVLTELCIDFQIRLYNDGSTDQTSERVREAFDSDPRIRLFEKENSGHGPTILLGYRESRDCQWILQIDSDDEMPAAPFQEMWKRRKEADFLIGYRHNRDNPWPRKIVTDISRITVWSLFGDQIRDVNSPYRLMKAELFRPLFENIPADTFAPNLIVSGFVSKQNLKVVNVEVPFEFRRTGTVSIKKWRLFKAAIKSFKQTLTYFISGKMPALNR
jgi:dolichol-phosphate mannosyltransferase